MSIDNQRMNWNIKNKKLPLRSLSMAIRITLKRLIIQTILSKLPCTKNDIHPYIPIVKKGITPIACEWCAVAARVAVPMCRPDVSVAVYRSLLSRCVGQMLLMRCGGGGRVHWLPYTIWLWWWQEHVMLSIFISFYSVSGKKPTICFCRKFALCCPFELKIGQAIHVTLGKVVLNFQPISLNRILKN